MSLYDSAKDIALPVLSIAISAVVAYLTARHIVQKELRVGHARLLDVTRRYFISVFNSLDANKNVKSDALSKEMHMEELDSVIRDIGSILGNPYFSKLILTHPLVSKIAVQARRELVEHRRTNNFSLNQDSILAFGNLNALLLKNVIAGSLDEAIAQTTKALS